MDPVLAGAITYRYDVALVNNTHLGLYKHRIGTF